MNKNLLFIIGGVVLFITIGIVIFSLVGRNNKNNNKQNQIVLTYWGLWEPESVMQSIIQKYEAQNPNVKIQYVQKPFTQYDANLYTRIQLNAVDNTPAPDIVRINNTWLSKYQTLLSPLPNDKMSPNTYASTFYPTAIKDFTGTDGRIYAVPLEIDGLAMFYNKKILTANGIKTLPTDWDTFIEVSKKLTKTDSKGKIIQAGAALGSSKNIKHSADILNLLFLQNSIEIIDSTNKVVNLISPRAISALDFYTSFTSKHNTWSTELGNDLEVFYSGKLAIMFAPSWRAFDIINSAPNIEFGIAPVPQLPGNIPINYAMYWGEAVPATSKYKDQAWDFILYLSRAENMKEFYSNSSQIRAFGEPYSRVDLNSELLNQPYVGAIMEMAPTMTAWKMGEQGYVEENLRTAINQVNNGINAQEALREAQTRINTKLSEVVK